MTFRAKMDLTVHSQFDKSRFLRSIFVLSSDIRVKNARLRIDSGKVKIKI